MIHMETVRLTASQALVRFLENQYISYIDMDGNEQEHKFVKGIFMLPGHGNVVGFANGVEQELKDMIVYQGKNEQGMALAAVGYAKQMRRKSIFACTSSVGPGACNMVTAAATATANNIPVLILPGDIYASRQPDPVLQQMEQPQNLSISAHDAFQAVTKYWGRINRPEQVMTDMISAMRVLTDTANTGAVAISLPQDVQAEAYDYPVDFFKKRVWRVDRRPITKYALDKAVEVIKNAKKPLLICGGGVRYAEAHKVFKKFAEDFGIAFGETQAGKSAVVWDHELNLGGLGTTGGIAANKLAHEADVVIGVGTRYTDFTTASKWLYRTDAKFVNINPSEFQAYKMDATPVVADANEALTAIGEELAKIGYHTDKAYAEEVAALRKEWWTEVERLDKVEYTDPGALHPGDATTTTVSALRSTSRIPAASCARPPFWAPSTISSMTTLSYVQQQALCRATCRVCGVHARRTPTTWSTVTPAWVTRLPPLWALRSLARIRKFTLCAATVPSTCCTPS